MATAEDGDGKTDTTTNDNKPAAIPNKPAPEGDGIMGAPFKRMKYVGVILLLYYILAFWLPVYWMAGAANYCKFICRNYPDSGTFSLSALGSSSSSSNSFGSSSSNPFGSSSISFGSSSTSYGSSMVNTINIDYASGSSSVSYGSSSAGISFGGSFSGVSVGGCYESTDVNCEQYCDAFCESCETAACDEFFDTTYQGAYISSGIDGRLATFCLIVIGMALAALGCVLGYFAVKQGNRLYSQIATGLCGIGGLMIFVGAVMFMATWNENIELEDVLAAWQILVLMEYAIPASIAIIIAIDIYNPLIFNIENKRILAFTLPFAIGGLLCGCLWAYIINYDYGIAVDFPLYDVGGCMAAGYFIFGLMSIGRILIWGEHIKIDDPASAITYKFFIALFLIIGAFICCVGYWAYIDTLFDCEVQLLSGSSVSICENVSLLYIINGDTVNAPAAIYGFYDVPYEAQFKCYYIAYTFFILLMAAVNVYDMDIMGNYKKVRAAQQAASAASAAK